MIVLSAGMQKSGTQWFYRMTDALFVANGGAASRQVFIEYQLADIIENQNLRAGSLGKITDEKLQKLLDPHVTGENFVVKTHQAPTPLVLKLIDEGVIKATYIYRDPRAVALSAYDHGIKMRKSRKLRPFGWIFTIELGMLYAKKLYKTWKKWTALDNVLLFKYEDLKSVPEVELRRLAKFLDLQVTDQQIVEIVASFSMDSVEENKKRLNRIHYNKGIADRFRNTFSARQLRLAEIFLSKEITDMGYSLK